MTTRRLALSLLCATAALPALAGTSRAGSPLPSSGPLPQNVSPQAQRPLPQHPAYPSSLDTPLWMMPEEDLRAAIDRMASSSQARSDAIGYYLDELDRRVQHRLNATMLDLNRTGVRLSWFAAIFSGLGIALTAIAFFLRRRRDGGSSREPISARRLAGSNTGARPETTVSLGRPPATTLLVSADPREASGPLEVPARFPNRASTGRGHQG